MPKFLTINADNINSYRGGIYNRTGMIWDYTYLDPHVLINFPYLRRLEIYADTLGKKNGLNGIEVCQSLRKLVIQNRDIISNAREIDIEPIGSLINLTSIKIRLMVPNIRPLLNIKGLKTLKILAYLDGISPRIFTDLSDIHILTQLEHLSCNSNLRINNETLERLTRLRYLDILDLQVIPKLPKLIHIRCDLSRTIFQDLAQLPQLRSLIITGNDEDNPPSINIWEQVVSQGFEKIFIQLEKLQLDKLMVADPHFLSKMKNLKNIIFECDVLHNFDIFSDCKRLRELVWLGDNLESIQGLESCSKLTKMELNLDIQKKNNLLCIKSLIYQRRLVSLIIDGFQLINTDSIRSCKNLEKIMLIGDTSSIDVNFVNDCPKLRTLYLESNCITNLDSIICPNITYLFLRNIKGHNLPLENFPGLRYLFINRCPSIHIHNLGTLKQLQYLQINNCSLQTVDLSCPNLKGIEITNSLIESFPFEKNQDLRYVNLKSNRIKSIETIKSCPSVHTLKLDDNEISDWSPLYHLSNLQVLTIRNNPVVKQNPIVSQIIQSFDAANENMNRKSSESIYQSYQSVHKSSIQKSVQKSVFNLLQDPIPPSYPESEDLDEIPDIQREVIMKHIHLNQTTLIEMFDLNFKEIFSYIWQRITKHPCREELIKILVQQIDESEGKCFMGLFTRILSVLAGFYEDINIEISDPDRISSIIIHTYNEITPYDPHMHRKMAFDALIQAGYQYSEIIDWVNSIE